MLTVVISSLNEGKEINETVKSIKETSDAKIIVIDDGSWPKVNVKGVRLVRNDVRKGRPASLDAGVEMARTPFIFLANARMRFKEGWTEGIEYLKKEPETVFCTTSVCLEYGNTDFKDRPRRYGAEILYYHRHPKLGYQILDPKWLKEGKEDIYEVPCVLGANYFITKKWYQKLKGFEGLHTWGGMDVFLSLKSWMAGGKCKIIKPIEIGNIYRDDPQKTPAECKYTFIPEDKFWNQIFTAFTLLQEGEATQLLTKLKAKKHYQMLVNRLHYFRPQIKEYKDYFNSIKKVNVMNYIRR